MKNYNISFKTVEFSLGDDVDPETYPKRYTLTPDVDKIVEVETCSFKGCDKAGYLSQRLGSSMYSYRMIVCTEHEKLLE